MIFIRDSPIITTNVEGSHSGYCNGLESRAPQGVHRFESDTLRTGYNYRDNSPESCALKGVRGFESHLLRFQNLTSIYELVKILT